MITYEWLHGLRSSTSTNICTLNVCVLLTFIKVQFVWCCPNHERWRYRGDPVQSICWCFFQQNHNRKTLISPQVLGDSLEHSNCRMIRSCLRGLQSFFDNLPCLCWDVVHNRRGGVWWFKDPHFSTKYHVKHTMEILRIHHCTWMIA